MVLRHAQVGMCVGCKFRMYITGISFARNIACVALMCETRHMSTSVQTLANTGFIPQWTIGDRLRKAREMTGLTQVQFAERVGLSRATVNNSELNKSQPRKSVVLLWAMETGVDRDWLMTGSANNETPDPDGPGGELLRLDSNQQPSD